jgi:hypothetical protein
MSAAREGLGLAAESADKNVGVAGWKAGSTLPTGQEAGPTWCGFGGMSKLQWQAKTPATRRSAEKSIYRLKLFFSASC